MGGNVLVQAEKGRESERIEKGRLAMTRWREWGGKESPRGAER